MIIPIPVAPQGWQCPGCHRCYSPTIPQCFHCGPGSWLAPRPGDVICGHGIAVADTTGKAPCSEE